MQSGSDTSYFVYFYVYTCDQCNFPHLDTLISETPQDLDRRSLDWRCKNCRSQQYVEFGNRTAAYVKALLVKDGKCSERYSVAS